MAFMMLVHMLILFHVPTIQSTADGKICLNDNDRVRVTSLRYDLRQQVGSISAIEGDTLQLAFFIPRHVRAWRRRHGGSSARVDSFRISRDAIECLELSCGQQRHTGLGMIAGFLLGGGAGAAVGSASGGGEPYAGVAIGMGALIGSVGGLFAGGIIGSLVETEDWQPVLVAQVTGQHEGK